MSRRIKLLLVVVLLAGLGLAAGALVLLFAGLPTYEVPTAVLPPDDRPQTVAHGRRLVGALCRRCHFDPATGRLSGRELPEIDDSMGRVAAPNLTRDPEAGIGTWTPGQIAYLLRTGVNPVSERLVPPFMPRWPRLADADAIAIAAFLGSDDPWVAPHSGGPERSRYSPLVTWRAYMDWEPFAYPTEPVARPSADDPVAYGGYLVDTLYRCHDCHSDDPERALRLDARATPGYLGGGERMADAAGEGVIGTNLTPHATGLGDWSVEDVRRALVDGFRPDGALVRWPMPRYPGLRAIEIEAIFAYLRTVPPLDRSIARPPRRVIGEIADPGRHVYERHGCPSCHDHDGLGMADLRGAFERLGGDAAVAAFVRNPAASDPDHAMPAFGGVIPEEELAALLAHLHRLAGEG